MSIVRCGNCHRNIDTAHLGKFCYHCGAPIVGIPIQPTVPRNAAYVQQPVYRQVRFQKAGHYAPGSVVEQLHNHFKKPLFLTGAILFSAGYLINLFVNFLGGFFALLLVALPIISMWMMYAASVSPQRPEKVLTALTLYKVYRIILFVIVCVIGVPMIILYIMALGNGVLMGVFILLILLLGAVMAYEIVYLRATLQVLYSIRDRITKNTFFALDGTKTFTVLSCVSAGISILNSIWINFSLDIGISMIRGMEGVPPLEASRLISLYSSLKASPLQIAISIFTLLVINTGFIIGVIVLNQFNDSLKRRQATSLSNFYPENRP